MTDAAKTTETGTGLKLAIDFGPLLAFFIANSLAGVFTATAAFMAATAVARSEEHTSELQSLMRISYAVFCLEKKTHGVIDIPRLIRRYSMNHRQKACTKHKNTDTIY